MSEKKFGASETIIRKLHENDSQEFKACDQVDSRVISRTIEYDKPIHYYPSGYIYTCSSTSQAKVRDTKKPLRF